jgi:hypothetical protein
LKEAARRQQEAEVSADDAADAMIKRSIDKHGP